MGKPRILVLNLAIAALLHSKFSGDAVVTIESRPDSYPNVSPLGMPNDRIPRRKGEKRRNRANRWR